MKNKLLLLAVVVIVFKGCLLRRNDFMLEHSCGVIAYYDGKPYGGTFYTCREARKRCMDIINLY